MNLPNPFVLNNELQGGLTRYYFLCFMILAFRPFPKERSNHSLHSSLYLLRLEIKRIQTKFQPKNRVAALLGIQHRSPAQDATSESNSSL